MDDECRSCAVAVHRGEVPVVGAPGERRRGLRERRGAPTRSAGDQRPHDTNPGAGSGRPFIFARWARNIGIWDAFVRRPGVKTGGQSVCGLPKPGGGAP